MNTEIDRPQPQHNYFSAEGQQERALAEIAAKNEANEWPEAITLSVLFISVAIMVSVAMLCGWHPWT